MADNPSSFIGTIPDNYDRFLGPNLFEHFAGEMAGRIAGYQPVSVLELAAGTGIVSRKLRDAISSDALLTVTDLNAPMLQVAKAKFASAEAVEFTPADAMALPFQDDQFDMVVCQFGVMFFPDIVASFREVARVLQPGGRYLFSTWGKQADNPLSQVAHTVIAEFFPDNPPGFYKVPFFYHDAEAAHADMAAAGLVNTDHAILHHDRVVTDIAGLAYGLVYGNPVVEEIRARGGVDPDDVVKRVHQGLVERFGQEPATMPLKIFVFSAQVP